MTKKAVIVISLVEESVEKVNEEIENDILEELQKTYLRFLGLKALRKSR